MKEEEKVGPMDRVSEKAGEDSKSGSGSGAEDYPSMGQVGPKKHMKSGVKGVILTKPNFYDGKIDLFSAKKKGGVNFQPRAGGYGIESDVEQDYLQRGFQLDDKSE